MVEYIERGALMVALCEEIVGDGDYYSGKDAMQDQIRDMVSQFPQADVAPVRHGRWVEKEKYTFGIMYDCSLCENRILDNGHPWNYCPNCGAKMDGGESNA